MMCMFSGNGEVVAGTGEQCPPFDEARCGDGRKATEAQLLGPKGAYTHEHKRQLDQQRAYQQGPRLLSSLWQAAH